MRKIRKIKEWTDWMGSAKKARKYGVTGRLFQVSDGGGCTWLLSTTERSAAVMLKRYAAIAKYDGRVTLRGKIISANGTEIDRATLTIYPKTWQV